MQTTVKYYLVGIKGTGMASLAKLLHDAGCYVIGSDTEEYYFTEDNLKKQGIPIKHFAAENITGEYFYIIGNAYQTSNVEVQEIIRQNYDYLYYHDFIGQKLKQDLIACAGTHGKTTTSFLLVHFLQKQCSYIIGDGEGGYKGGNLLILEACEYKEHFLSYHPKLLIITNIELDHTDYYKNSKQLFLAFQKLANQSEKILVNGDDKTCQKILHSNKIMYGFQRHNDIQIKILSTTSKGYYIKISYRQKNIYLKIPYLGKHMIYNFVASYMATLLMDKIPYLEEKNLLPKRRLSTYLFQNSILIDDYAHHPTEIKALLETLRLTYPKKPLKVIFQPHTYERTLHFKKYFKKVLKHFDQVYLVDVFTSKREKKNQKLQKKIDSYFKLFPKYCNEVLETIGSHDEVWIFLGAGVINDYIKKLINENN